MVERPSALRGGSNGEVKEAEPFLTAPEVYAEIIQNHPEVLQITIVSYPPYPHGEWPGDYYSELIPVVNLSSTLAQGSWPRRCLSVNEVVAIGAVVDVCNEAGCSHGRKDHYEKENQLWDYWHEGLMLPWGEPLSFVFLDIEWHRSIALVKVLEALEGAKTDWYLLDSGGGYHVVFDELVSLADLPGRYGEIIANFGDRLHNSKLKGWGDDLVRNGDNRKKVTSWCEDVLRDCGHVDEPVGRETHIVDLRHTAHSLLRMAGYCSWLDQNPSDLGWRRSSVPGVRIGGAYLRISPSKNFLSPPILVAKKTGEELMLFGSEERPFHQQPATQGVLL